MTPTNGRFNVFSKIANHSFNGGPAEWRQPMLFDQGGNVLNPVCAHIKGKGGSTASGVTPRATAKPSRYSQISQAFHARPFNLRTEQWVIPPEDRWRKAQIGEEGWYPVHESIIQNAAASAVKKVEPTKRATGHRFRHSLATKLLESGYDIRTVQERLGHKDVKTVLIDTHVLNRGGKGIKSPMDDLQVICKGETKVSYTETIYPSASPATQGLIFCKNVCYERIAGGVLGSDVATQKCYEETI